MVGTAILLCLTLVFVALTSKGAVPGIFFALFVPSSLEFLSLYSVRKEFSRKVTWSSAAL